MITARLCGGIQCVICAICIFFGGGIFLGDGMCSLALCGLFLFDLSSKLIHLFFDAAFDAKKRASTRKHRALFTRCLHGK